MRQIESTTESTQTDLQDTAAKLARVQSKLTEVYQGRCSSAWERYLEAANAAGAAWLEQTRAATPLDFWRDSQAYCLDFMQRSVLFWDTLRQRGNNWLEHEKAGKPPLLDFEWEMIADARRFERPANYALVQIKPPAGIKLDPELRPFVIIDPRAGHGPGIGGFKQDSQSAWRARRGIRSTS